MLLVKPIHSPAFLERHNLGVEAVIDHDDQKETWAQYVPFVKGAHLPFSYGINLGAINPDDRQQALQTLKQAIDKARKCSVKRMVVHTSGFEALAEKVVGEYAIMIEGLQKLADYAATDGTILCIENQMHREPHKRRVYGDTLDEWFRILKDVDRPNTMLTLDSSHAASSVALIEDADARRAALFEFLEHPEQIGYVHWSDSRIGNREALHNDMHLVPGKGDLPRDFHKRIKQLDCPKLLEQNCTEDEVIEAFRFIDGV